jgi:hypothetical protein
MNNLERSFRGGGHCHVSRRFHRSPGWSPRILYETASVFFYADFSGGSS